MGFVTVSTGLILPYWMGLPIRYIHHIYCFYIFLIRIALTDVFPIDVSIASPLAGTDLLLCALFGGMISGIGNRRYLCDDI